MALKFACSLCGCNEPRAGCPRCEERQPSLFSPPRPPIPDDADTVTLADVVLDSDRQKRLHAGRIARLARLGRAIRVGLVGCAKTKRESAAPARELYKSPLFVAALAYAERACDETFVISAAHGLLSLDETVSPYDRALGALPKKDRLAWGRRVAESIAATFERLPLHIFVFAGLDYVEPIQGAAHGRGWLLEAPLAKKTLGQRLQWFKAQEPPERSHKRARGAS